MKLANNPYLTILRDKNSSMEEFRKAADNLSHLLAQQVLLSLECSPKGIDTPLAHYEGTTLNKNIVIIPILRAGLAMFGMFKHYFPGPVGFLGIGRNEETAAAQVYYENVPKAKSNSLAILLDPMLATGGTALAAVSILKEKGYQESDIIFSGMISAKPGREKFSSRYPQVKLIIAAEDPKLNDKKFIVPGLGDFGDRYFATECSLHGGGIAG